MPNITEFNAPELRIQPTEIGVESQAAAGRRLGVYGSQIAGSIERGASEIGRGINTAEEYVGHQEISAGAASGAQLQADQIEKKDAAIKAIDPNDPHYGQKVEFAVKQWRDNLESSLQDFSNQFHTPKSQEWSQRFVDNTRNTMFVHSTADIQTAAGIGFHNSARTIVNTATNTVFQHPDMLQSQFDLVEHGLTGLVQSNPVKGVEAGKLLGGELERAKEQIAKAAIQGTVMNGGNWQALANDPRYSQYVSGAEVAQFDKAAKIQAKQSELLTRQIQNEQKRTAELDLNTSINTSSAKNVTFNPDGTSNIDPQFVKDVNNLTNPVDANGNPRLLAPNAWKVKQELGNWIEHQQKNPKGGTSDAATVAELDSRLFSADNPTTTMDLRRAQVAGKLSNQDFSTREGLIKERDAAPIKNPIFKQATDQAKITIEGTTPGERAIAGGKYAAFMQNFLTEYLKESRAGTLAPNALDLTDENSLISKTMAPFRMNLGASISANGGVGAPSTAAPPVSTAPPVSLPPIAKREKGKSYMTGRGMMEWTGTGWRPPEVPAQPATVQPAASM